MVTGVFVEGRRHSYFILAIDKNKKDHKNLRSNLTSRLLPEIGRSQSNEPWNKKQTKRIEVTNHESQAMTFWIRASKQVFPKRSAKMIDGTEKPKVC